MLRGEARQAAYIAAHGAFSKTPNHKRPKRPKIAQSDAPKTECHDKQI